MSELLSHDPAHLHVATRQGIFGARDDGAEMDIFPLALHGVAVRCLLTDAKGVLLAAGTRERGVELSRDGGKSWKGAAGTSGHDVSALSGGASGMLAGAASPARLLRSDDGGSSFAAADLSTAAADSRVSALLESGGRVFLGRSDGGVWTSSDGGRTFHDLSAGLPAGTLCLAASGERLLAGTREGLFATPLASPGPWSRLFGESPRRAVTAVAVHPADPRRIACGVSRAVGLARPGEPKGADSWLIASEDGGASFHELANPRLPVLRGLVTAIVFRPGRAGSFYAAASSGEIFERMEGENGFTLAAATIPSIDGLAAGPLLA